MGRVEDKVAIVTGGAMGIGEAAAILLAREGARVIVADIMDKEGALTVEEIKRKNGVALFRHLDVTREVDVEKAYKGIYDDFGRIDILVNNAGITGVRKPTHEIKEEEWDKVMSVNVKGVFYSTKHAVPYMKNSGGGSIINIASVLGIVGSPGAPPYVASKGAVRLMTKTDALIYAKDKIRVNSIDPGFIRTPLIENYLKSTGDPEGGRKKLDALHPLGHIGEPIDVGYAILYLASDESKFVTGSDLVVDGGYTAQ